MFTDPENKLKELSSNAYKHLKKIAQIVKDRMAEGTYVPLYITSVKRTPETQVKILMRKLDPYRDPVDPAETGQPSVNMYQYYFKTINKEPYSSTTLNYLQPIQAYYDGSEPDPKHLAKLPSLHRKNIAEILEFDRTENSGVESIVIDNLKFKMTQRQKKVYEILTAYVGPVFKPSYHMIGNNIIDLRNKEKHENTSKNIWSATNKFLKINDKLFPFGFIVIKDENGVEIKKKQKSFGYTVTNPDDGDQHDHLTLLDPAFKYEDSLYEGVQEYKIEEDYPFNT